MERVVRSGAAPWTVVRPSRLLDDPGPPGFIASADARPKGPSSLRRVDRASFLADEVSLRQYVRQIVGVTSGLAS